LPANSFAAANFAFRVSVFSIHDPPAGPVGSQRLSEIGGAAGRLPIKTLGSLLKKGLRLTVKSAFSSRSDWQHTNARQHESAKSDGVNYQAPVFFVGKPLSKSAIFDRLPL
jgi:hypothetical protein